MKQLSTPNPYLGKYSQLPKAEQLAARQRAAAHRELRYNDRMRAGSVLPPLPAPTIAELRSQLISIDREIAALERGRAALCRQLDESMTKPDESSEYH